MAAAGRGATAAGLCALLFAGCLDVPTLGPGVYCDDRAPCASDPRYPRCDALAHQCVAAADLGVVMAGCTADAACAGDALHPVCDTALGQCVACRGGADDAACAARGPAAPLCDPASGRCVACRAGAMDCASAALPVCDQGVCRGCRDHRECPVSGVCKDDGNKDDGTCVPANQVVYVDNRGDQACAGNHTGRLGDPFCQIPEALLSLGALPYVRVAGSAVRYHRFTLAGAPAHVTLIGAGRDAAVRSTINDATGPCITPAAGKQLRIEGMELVGCTFGIGGATGGTFDVRQSLIHGMIGGPGVELRLPTGPQSFDGVIISDNAQGGGLRLFGAVDFVVKNSFFAGNRGSFGGVYIDPASSGTFAFNTVRGNAGTNVAGGVDCGDADHQSAVKITASIVVGNSHVGAGATGQIGAFCTPDGVVAGAAAAGPGFIAADPVWASSSVSIDYRLDATPGVNAQIIDALPSQPLYLLDIDRTARPLGQGWDIGAHEAR